MRSAFHSSELCVLFGMLSISNVYHYMLLVSSQTMTTVSMADCDVMLLKLLGALNVDVPRITPKMSR